MRNLKSDEDTFPALRKKSTCAEYRCCMHGRRERKVTFV